MSEKNQVTLLCVDCSSPVHKSITNSVTNTLQDLLAAVCGHWTMQRTGHAFLQHFSAAATSNYFHRTGTVLRGEAQKPGGERVKSRRLSNLIRVFMFVYPRSFDLTTGRRETLDWELQSCKVRRKVSTENARDRAYLSLCCQTRIVHFQYTTHIFPFKPPPVGIVLQKM